LTVLSPGDVVVLDVERPVAGGRMLARHDGQVVLVAGAIPGERVSARVDRVARSVAHAETVDVLTASPDRRDSHDWRCGGRDYAHIAYDRQRDLKAEVVADAFRRLARLPLAQPLEVMGSPEEGYRLRARLHVDGGRLGFFREGTHQVCDAAGTGQLSDGALEWMRAAEQALTPQLARSLLAVEIAENVPGTERGVHLTVSGPVDRAAIAPLVDGLVGLSAQSELHGDAVRLAGMPVVTDRLAVRSGEGGPSLVLARDVRSFFQANRFLLEPLVQHVVGLLLDGTVADLYAGVGLFGLAAAATGHSRVMLVEGDRTSSADLEINALPFMGRARVLRRSVEAALGDGAVRAVTTAIVDPPRTGLSTAAREGLVRLGPARVVYVSCDVATLARDARALVDGGYRLSEIRAVDLFPATAHVECVAVFDRKQ
jgi:23S rRNA (uracil1939-C5)-methyltransferase